MRTSGVLLVHRPANVPGIECDPLPGERRADRHGPGERDGLGHVRRPHAVHAEVEFHEHAHRTVGGPGCGVQVLDGAERVERHRERDGAGEGGQSLGARGTDGGIGHQQVVGHRRHHFGFEGRRTGESHRAALHLLRGHARGLVRLHVGAEGQPVRTRVRRGAVQIGLQAIEVNQRDGRFERGEGNRSEHASGFGCPNLHPAIPSRHAPRAGYGAAAVRRSASQPTRRCASSSHSVRRTLFRLSRMPMVVACWSCVLAAWHSCSR